MSEYLNNKIDFIIMIVLALLVAFIIGFNIIQLVDSKLSSVTINVPPHGCQLPPIYLNMDSDSNIKQIKLNDVISTTSNESIMINSSTNSIPGDISEDFSNIPAQQKYSPSVSPNTISTPEPHTPNEIEQFGNIQDYPLVYDDNRRHLISGIINSDLGNQIIGQKTKYQTAQDPNYNTVNDIPLLVAPDTDVPNRAGPDAKGYFASRVRLIEDPNSPLMKLAKTNADKINGVVARCAAADRKRVPEVNGTFDGYNAFVDLRTDSYANVTSIGKSMLSPYISYPVPS
jgi:hypothetical protein